MFYTAHRDGQNVLKSSIGLKFIEKLMSEYRNTFLNCNRIDPDGHLK
jgi:hypothetical protein